MHYFLDFILIELVLYVAVLLALIFLWKRLDGMRTIICVCVVGLLLKSLIEAYWSFPKFGFLKNVTGEIISIVVFHIGLASYVLLIAMVFVTSKVNKREESHGG